MSTDYFKEALETYKYRNNRQTTNDTYMGVWRNFNNFIIALDRIPDTWEEKISVYYAFLIEICGLQSSTIRSYVSGIKKVLRAINYVCDDEKILLAAITGTCKRENDTAPNRLPIQKNLMEQILFEIERKYSLELAQPYLELLYKTAIIFLYYGLLRISEICHTKAGHALKAKDVHFAENKQKILLVLHSSKTHGREARPQKIKISATLNTLKIWRNRKHFCPFEVTCEFLKARGQEYYSQEEHFFVFADRSPLTADTLRKIIKQAINKIGLDANLYDTHSFRIGRATDLQRMKCPVDTIKAVGRWKSNAVYRYLRN